ncbi:MAG: hypothetical protein H6826_14410 [Planctomycetes bacterium]|nr:hypothetical protein [Planctomycetota bacterium]
MSRTASVTTIDEAPAEADKPGRINIQIRRTKGGVFQHLRSASISEAFLHLIERQLDELERADEADRDLRRRLRFAG